MEKKIGIIIVTGFILTLIIYFVFKNDEIDYISIGDSFTTNLSENNFTNLIAAELSSLGTYNNSYSYNNLSSRDLFDMLYSNNKIANNKLTINQLLSSAELVTIALGIDELLTMANVNLYLYYLDKSIMLINEVTDAKIYLIGLNSNVDKITDINKEIQNIAKKHNINYINVSDLSVNYPLNKYENNKLKDYILEDFNVK